jgi:hypothetical protein
MLEDIPVRIRRKGMRVRVLQKVVKGSGGI